MVWHALPKGDFAFYLPLVFLKRTVTFRAALSFMGDCGMYSVDICWPTTTEPTTKHFHKTELWQMLLSYGREFGWTQWGNWHDKLLKQETWVMAIDPSLLVISWATRLPSPVYTWSCLEEDDQLLVIYLVLSSFMILSLMGFLAWFFKKRKLYSFSHLNFSYCEIFSKTSA